MTAPTDVEPAKPGGNAWKWALAAVVAYPFLLLLWMVFDFRVLNPALMDTDVETTMDRIRWFGVPALVLLMVLFIGKWFGTDAATARAQERQEKTQQLTAQQVAAQGSEKMRREYVLEVLGMGVTYEKYRQGKLWDALQQGSPHMSMRETDPIKYPWMGTDKLGQSGGRAYDALENGAKFSPMYWGVPSFYASGPNGDPAEQHSEISPMAGLAGGARTSGLPWHMFVVGQWQLSERPDQLLEQVFAFLDMHPDLPYVVLTADDSSANRDLGLPHGAPSIIKDGNYIPEMPDSTAVFVLARRERVEPLRPFLWDDPDDDHVRENLGQRYYQLMDEVPTPDKLAHPEKLNMPRLPTVAEWLKDAAVFARHPYYKPKPNEDPPGRWRGEPPKGWQPSPWFPVPWSRAQMEAFDKLPSLGFVHRPVFVKFEDEQGKPVKRREARQKILEAGWQQALNTLSDAERAAGPARIVAAFGERIEHQVTLDAVLRQYAAKGGPEIDTGKTAQFINTDRRLGNTGAATFFMQMALGVMGSYTNGGPSAAINLRDPAGASIVFISPPSAERRKAQRLEFTTQVTPAIDPANYKAPTVGEVMGTSGAAGAGDTGDTGKQH